MSQDANVRIVAVRLYFLPVRTRVPLKFGRETLTTVTCARVRMTLEGDRGRRADGWGETPLSVQWGWPGASPYDERHEAMKAFCRRLAGEWCRSAPEGGDAIAIGWRFLEGRLPGVAESFNRDERDGSEPMPRLASLICASPFDLALHDAYGVLRGVPTYETYRAPRFRGDLSHYLEAEDGVDFRGLVPGDFLAERAPSRLHAWHLVGGNDPIDEGDLTGDEPDDGYPVLLRDWIRRDGLTCLKVKLRGNDASWDYDRMLRVGRLAAREGVGDLTADFNCTVLDPGYVVEVLDRLRADAPEIVGHLTYVEQPFPYDLEAHPIDVRAVSSRVPLFMDESAHDWRLVRFGRALGWTGVALKTCKTQTGALLAGCWARAHGMDLMVQDLTNPMLAQVPHCLLAAHVGTIRGVETNAMQFYPDASAPESAVHPGLYRRRDGMVDLGTIRGPGFGYRVDEIARPLPEPAAVSEC